MEKSSAFAICAFTHSRYSRASSARALRTTGPCSGATAAAAVAGAGADNAAASPPPAYFDAAPMSKRVSLGATDGPAAGFLGEDPDDPGEEETPERYGASLSSAAEAGRAMGASMQSKK